jgi:prefoldin subunit 5
MKTVQKIVSQIEAQRKTISRLQSDSLMFADSISGVDKHLEALENTKAERLHIQAEAMISRKSADVKAIDAKIDHLQSQHDACRETATTATESLKIIQAGIAIAEGHLPVLEEQLADAVSSEILARHQAAQERYVTAVAAIEEAVTGLVASHRAWDQVANQLGLPVFPEHGQMVLAELYKKGLRVPYTHSRLSDPVVAAEYRSDFKNFWHAPKFIDPLTKGFADDAVQEIVDALQESGVHCGDLQLYVPPKPEKQLKVRVVMGSVEVQEIERDPENGSIFSKKSVYFDRGSDCMLAESEARNLRANGIVIIHGEDAMPSPPPRATEPERVEMREATQTFEINLVPRFR